MKIIKRNGSEVPFDITKIITAVTKASDSVGGKSRLTREQITQIASDVTDQCHALNRAVSVEDSVLQAEDKLAIVLGTEGDGLANNTIAACDYTVKIPMSHGVDSLNVAAASAVAFWQLGRL